VAEVAGVLEGDRDLQRVALGARDGQQLGDVDGVGDAVVLEVRAAAGGVGDDVVVAGERRLQCPGPRDSLIEAAGVGVQRAAAPARSRC
jgi:hypothetical protein